MAASPPTIHMLIHVTLTLASRASGEDFIARLRRNRGIVGHSVEPGFLVRGKRNSSSPLYGGALIENVLLRVTHGISGCSSDLECLSEKHHTIE